MNKIDAPFGHIYLCVRAHLRMRDGLRDRGWGGGWGSGWSPCKPRDCLRQAKGAPDGDGTAGRRVSWKPNANAEGLAGRAEATQVCSAHLRHRALQYRMPLKLDVYATSYEGSFILSVIHKQTQVWTTGRDYDDPAAAANLFFLKLPEQKYLHQSRKELYSGKESACQCRRHIRCRFDPWTGKIPCRRK